MRHNESNPWAELIASSEIITIKAESKKKDKKRRYSSPTSWMAGIFEERVLGGMADAAVEYDRRRKRSLAKHKEGALRDLSKNTMASQAEMFRGLAKIPVDVIDMMEATGKGWFWL